MVRLLPFLLAAGAALTSCRTEVIPPGGISGDCPASSPIGGEPCGAPALCGYLVASGPASTDCTESFTCRDNVWQPAGSNCPPPTAPGACPTSIPGTGAPCASPGQSCTFDVPGPCPGVFVATCTSNAWSIADQSPPCTPPQCPPTEPTAGTACNYAFSCTYTVLPDGCPPHTENATCTGGVWQIEVPPDPCGP